MTLLEIVSGAIASYRATINYSLQHRDYDTVLICLNTMVELLPKKDRIELEPFPEPETLAQKSMLQDIKYRYIMKWLPQIERRNASWAMNSLRSTSE